MNLISPEQEKFGKNLDYIFEKCHDFKNLPRLMFISNLKNFRIVKMPNGTDSDWYLLQKRTNIVSRFFGLFSKEIIQWRVVCGCDRSAPGMFNYTADKSCNSIAPLLHSIPEVLKAELGNRQFHRFDREGYPNSKIIKELDIQKTLEVVDFNDEKDVFHALLEKSVIIDKE